MKAFLTDVSPDITQRTSHPSSRQSFAFYVNTLCLKGPFLALQHKF